MPLWIENISITMRVKVFIPTIPETFYLTLISKVYAFFKCHLTPLPSLGMIGVSYTNNICCIRIIVVPPTHSVMD